jgi:hypothetical protein
MSWEQFQSDAYKLTEAETRVLSRKVLTAYNIAMDNIDKLISDAYLKVLSNVDKAGFYNEMIKFDRLKKILEQIRYEYGLSYKDIYKHISNASSLSFSNMYYRKIYANSWLEEGLTVAILPKDLIKLSINGTANEWKKISKSLEETFGARVNYIPRAGTLKELLAKNMKGELAKIQSSLTQGLANGISYTQMKNNIKNVIGVQMEKAGKFTVNGAKANSLRIIRTETNRIMNNGSYAASKVAEVQGVDIRRRWVAVFDNKTRRQSASMDGQEVGIDEPFIYPNGARAMKPGESGVAKYDINERCGVIDIVNGQGPQIRRGRNPNTGKNEVFEYTGFDTWAKEKGLKQNYYGEWVG